MPLKTEAVCTVRSEQFHTMNLGYRKDAKVGDTIRLPQHVAKQMEEAGAVTIVTAADAS